MNSIYHSLNQSLVQLSAEEAAAHLTRGAYIIVCGEFTFYSESIRGGEESNLLSFVQENHLQPEFLLVRSDANEVSMFSVLLEDEQLVFQFCFAMDISAVPSVLRSLDEKHDPITARYEDEYICVSVSAYLTDDVLIRRLLRDAKDHGRIKSPPDWVASNR